MLTSIQGKFRNGIIELSEIPHIEGDADVVVTFLPPASERDVSEASQMITFGMLSQPGHRMSELDDFKIAEFDEGKWDRD